MRHKSLNILLGGMLVISSALLTMAVLSYFGFLKWDGPRSPDSTSLVMKDGEADPMETQHAAEPNLRQVTEPKEVQAIEEGSTTPAEDWRTSLRVTKCLSKLGSLIEAKAIRQEDGEMILKLIQEDKIDAAIQLLDAKATPAQKAWARLSYLKQGKDISHADHNRIFGFILDEEIDAAIQALDSLPAYNPWIQGEVYGDEAKTKLLLEKCKIFGISFRAVVGYEMARARIPTPRIVETLKTYGSFGDFLLWDLDRIRKQVEDRHFRQRLYELSNAIDQEMSP